MQRNPEVAALRAIAQRYRAAAEKLEGAANDLENNPSLELTPLLSILKGARTEPRPETIVEACQQILKKEKRPMRARELVLAYTARVGHSVDRASVSVVLSRNKTLFKRVGTRGWGLM